MLDVYKPTERGIILKSRAKTGIQQRHPKFPQSALTMSHLYRALPRLRLGRLNLFFLPPSTLNQPLGLVNPLIIRQQRAL
jgi:hypothetical protein